MTAEFPVARPGSATALGPHAAMSAQLARWRDAVAAAQPARRDGVQPLAATQLGAVALRVAQTSTAPEGLPVGPRATVASSRSSHRQAAADSPSSSACPGGWLSQDKQAGLWLSSGVGDQGRPLALAAAGRDGSDGARRSRFISAAEAAYQAAQPARGRAPGSTTHRPVRPHGGSP